MDVEVLSPEYKPDPGQLLGQGYRKYSFLGGGVKIKIVGQNQFGKSNKLEILEGKVELF